MNFEKLKNFMDKMSIDRSPGNTAEVYLDGKQVFKYACGYADLENKTPLTGDEYFNIYSCSKITTVTAGMQLLEKGEFLLTDPLYEYIPEFKNMNVKNQDGTITEAKNIITVGDLFSMTAGFTYDFSLPSYEKARQLTNGKMDTKTVIKCLAEEPLAFEPGTHWQYSVCHDVLAGFIEIVSGMKFRDYVKKNIFAPLDMTHSMYHQTKDMESQIASQYQFIPDGAGLDIDLVEAQKNGTTAKGGTFKNVGKAVVDHVLGDEYDSGGAGVTTTVSDYAKLLAALANFGTGLNGERILSKSAVNLMRTDRLNDNTRKDFCWTALKGCSYGLGVRIHPYPSVSGIMASKGEFGWGGAAGASAFIDPENGLAVFYAQHCLNPREEYYQPRLRNILYACI